MGNKRALVVDDSKVGRLTMKKKLEALGIDVEQVESGQEALDFLAGHRPDMIFMDHMMPGLDGFETTRRIKADPAVRDIPVIIISGSDDEEFVREARAAGALSAISKPPAPGVLETLLADLPEVTAAPVVETAVEPAPSAEIPVPGIPQKMPAPGLDQAAVHNLIERALGEVVEHLHEDLLATLDQRLTTGLENGRQALEGLMASLAERVEGQDAALAQIQAQGDALAQGQEALSGQLLQALQARAEATATEGDAKLRDLASQQEGLARALQSSTDGFQARLQDIDQNLEQKASRLAALEQGLAEARDSALDESRLLVALEAHLAPRMEALQGSVREELASSLGPVLEESLRARLADMVRAQYDTVRAEMSSRAETEPAPESAPDLAALQARLEHVESAWDARFTSLAERFDGPVPEALEDRLEQALGQALDQRIQILREEWDTRSSPSGIQGQDLVSPELAPKESSEAGAGHTAPTGGETAQDDGALSMQVTRLTRRVKVLGLAIALGGVALIAALALMVFK